MITLAFDSTAKAASVAVCEDYKALALYTVDNGLTQSELLLPMAENILKSLKLTFDDIDLFACAVGPGSFTGVRIGVALVKGLALGKSKPCISVSTLEELAENARGLEGLIVPVMDARRSQVYTAIFESDGNELIRKSPDLALSLLDLAKILKEYSEKDIYLIGDGYDVTKKALTAEGVLLKNTPELLINENAYSVATVALRKFKANEYCDDLSISPTYLRLPQAERERLEKNKEAEKKQS